MFIAAFAIVALGLLVARDVVGSVIGSLLGPVGGAPSGTPLSYVIAAFFVAFFVAYAALASGSAWRRLRFAVVVVILFGLVAVAIELVAGAVIGPNNAEVVEVVANLGLAYAGMTILSAAIIATHRLPEGVVVETVRRRSPRYGITLVVTVIVAATVAWLVAQAAADALEWLRDLALLGGILPGIVLFRLLVNVQWFAIARADLRRRVAARDMASVAFIVPAFNEEEYVADCVKAIDSAATQHPGRTRIYVVDNGSADDTVNRARVALLTCRTASGTVVDCPQPGKAYALNRGLGAADEDIVIRVDADTLVEPDLIGRVLGHFSDPDVGAVGGMPIPRDQRSVFAPLRLIEVFERIGFVRVATNAIDSVMVAPGTLAAYPRDVLYALDGFVTGTNGEDTDMTIRIGRLGYRVVTDPAIRVRSEVPASVRHLREQRIRWSRSMYHVLAQHLSAIRMRQGPRGVAAIPWALVHLPRQPMMIPVAIFSLLVALVDPTLLPLHGGAAILAIILGLQLLVTVGVLAANRRLDLAQYLPDYVGFRVLRSYFALESLFTLTMDPAAEALSVSQPANSQATVEQAGSS
jgi:cellulose synthase/poly-beta-1,6-N-acetylglucosamine synthase-like glycosyltransferase